MTPAIFQSAASGHVQAIVRHAIQSVFHTHGWHILMLQAKRTRDERQWWKRFFG